MLFRSDEVTVLVTGSVLYSGRPDGVRNHPDVLEAYIGSRGDHLDGDVALPDATKEPVD